MNRNTAKNVENPLPRLRAYFSNNLMLISSSHMLDSLAGFRSASMTKEKGHLAANPSMKTSILHAASAAVGFALTTGWRKIPSTL